MLQNYFLVTLCVALCSLRRQLDYAAVSILGLATYWDWRSVSGADDPV